MKILEPNLNNVFVNPYENKLLQIQNSVIKDSSSEEHLGLTDSDHTQPGIACVKLTIEILEQGLKFVQS